MYDGYPDEEDVGEQMYQWAREWAAPGSRVTVQYTVTGPDGATITSSVVTGGAGLTKGNPVTLAVATDGVPAGRLRRVTARCHSPSDFGSRSSRRNSHSSIVRSRQYRSHHTCTSRSRPRIARFAATRASMTRVAVGVGAGVASDMADTWVTVVSLSVPGPNPLRDKS